MASQLVVPPPRAGDKGGFVSFGHCLHVVKLRHDWKASDRLRVQLGLDYDIKRSATKPWAGVRLLLDDKPDSWAAEINTDWGLLATPKVDLLGFTDRASLPISARLGRDFYRDGAPHVELGLHNPIVALALLAVSLATGAPVQIKRREAGGLSAALPIRFRDGREVAHQAQARVELDATLQRVGRGLRLDVHELNPVLRLSQL